MKTKTTLILAILISMGISDELTAAKRFVEYTKRGGFFGLYNYVEQRYNGKDQDGNHHYSMHCFDPGTTRCLLKNAPYKLEPTDLDNEIEGIENHLMEKLINEIEEKMGPRIKDGRITNKYQVQLSNGEYIWVNINLKWTVIDRNEEGNTIKFATEIWSTEAGL